MAWLPFQKETMDMTKTFSFSDGSILPILVPTRKTSRTTRLETFSTQNSNLSLSSLEIPSGRGSNLSSPSPRQKRSISIWFSDSNSWLKIASHRLKLWQSTQTEQSLNRNFDYNSFYKAPRFGNLYPFWATFRAVGDNFFSFGDSAFWLLFGLILKLNKNLFKPVFKKVLNWL